MTAYQYIVATLILIDLMLSAYYDLFKDDEIKCIKYFMFAMGLYIVGFAS